MRRSASFDSRLLRRALLALSLSANTFSASDLAARSEDTSAAMDGICSTSNDWSCSSAVDRRCVNSSVADARAAPRSVSAANVALVLSSWSRRWSLSSPSTRNCVVHSVTFAVLSCSAAASCTSSFSFSSSTATTRWLLLASFDFNCKFSSDIVCKNADTPVLSADRCCSSDSKLSRTSRRSASCCVSRAWCCCMLWCELRRDSSSAATRSYFSIADDASSARALHLPNAFSNATFSCSSEYIWLVAADSSALAVCSCCCKHRLWCSEIFKFSTFPCKFDFSDVYSNFCEITRFFIAVRLLMISFRFRLWVPVSSLFDCRPSNSKAARVGRFWLMTLIMSWNCSSEDITCDSRLSFSDCSVSKVILRSKKRSSLVSDSACKLLKSAVCLLRRIWQSCRSISMADIWCESSDIFPSFIDSWRWYLLCDSSYRAISVDNSSSNI